MDKYKIEKESRTYDDWIKVKKSIVSLNDDYFERSKVEFPDASAVLLYNQDKKCFIFVKQNRYPIISKHGEELILEVPAGRLEDAEDPFEGAKREVLEETGYTISKKNTDKVFQYFPAVGYSSERTTIFISIVFDKDKTHEGGGLKEEDEFIDIVEIPLQEAYNMLSKDEIKDGKTIISLLYFKEILNQLNSK